MTFVARTKAQLEQAKKTGEAEIIVEGELADKLKKAKKVALLSAAGLAALTAALGVATVAAPVTGGLAYFALAPVAAITGMEIAAIIAAASLGIALIIALYKDYEEISYKKGELKLRRKQRPT